MAYDGGLLESWDEDEAFAIIDTGTTNIVVPEQYFARIQEVWNYQIGKTKEFQCS